MTREPIFIQAIERETGALISGVRFAKVGDVQPTLDRFIRSCRPRPGYRTTFRIYSHEPATWQQVHGHFARALASGAINELEYAERCDVWRKRLAI